MKPTHRHVDGGYYELVEPCPIKHPITGEWVNGVAYRGEDNKLRATTLERWEERFEELECHHVAEETIDIQDDGDVVAEFTFRLSEVRDVRHMLITAGPQNKARTQLSNDFLDWMKRVLQAQADMITSGLHIRMDDFPDMIGDVHAFHAKFGQEYIGKPRLLPRDLHDFRVKFHDEETGEYSDEYENLVDAVARGDRRDILHSLEQQLDALVDAAWVILGTADLQFGRDAFTKAWERVVVANMGKVRKDQAKDGHTDSGRAAKFDIVKPAGWLPPTHRDLVEDNAIFDELFGAKEKVDG